ncbi:MAG: IS701 family transposase [Candidatus Hatepunaea meridiana]|nr:IS701 family transposase [Candidatus Hatepunaea meridiana]
MDKYLDDLLKTIGRSERRKWGALYVEGLLAESERKTVSAICSRCPEGNTQAVQQLLHSSPWNSDSVHLEMTRMAIAESKPVEVSIIDDTGFPKQGKHSVGVARQYSGTLGKVDNCQVAVSLHWASEQASFPMNWKLYLPEKWTDDPERCKKAGVPEDVTFRKKWELALDMIDWALGNSLPMGVILADHAYGVVTKFREGLESRKLTYSIGIDGDMVFWRHPAQRYPVPYKGRGRPPKPRYKPDDVPETAKQIANALTDDAWEEIIYGEGTTKGPLIAEFAAVRVQSAYGYHWNAPEQPMVWLLFERKSSEKSPCKYFLSNMYESTSLTMLVKTTKMRWRIEIDYKMLKGEAGLDFYEGRSWNGWHHHVTLSTMAYLFLLLERFRGDFPPSTLANH